ncbi:hypothetical protein [Leisingera sp. MMG026]|uniref:hypothetical protein n=1 Tax=Leisingera sp. MMG026 TaxID=2909982 RepID=UPI001F2BF768|nr:hypothetical protein [Leisingera sp. MMG026]MCF6429424.1 hypothetical protein [Leisingera sp. MMG026]
MRVTKYAAAVSLIAATFLPGIGHSSPDVTQVQARFRALEALYFLPLGAFPARELHTIYPGDLIDVDRGTRILGAGGNKKNTCYPALMIKGPHDSKEAGFLGTMSAELLVGGSGGAGPGGLIAIDAAGRFEMSKLAKFDVERLTQMDPSAGESVLYHPEATPECRPYADVLAYDFRGRAIISRVFRGREVLVAGISLNAGVSGSIEKSELLSVLEAAAGISALPIDSVTVSADGRSAGFNVISKPGKGHLALGYLPMHLNKRQVAAVHYSLQGQRGTELRSLVNAALNTPEPGVFADIVQEIRALFGGELDDEAWANRFLSAPPELAGDFMQPAEEVLKAFGEEAPDYLRSLAYYAAAAELSSAVNDFQE